jgi:hypothetical protein
MKPGDLVRICTPEYEKDYAEKYWEQIGLIIEVGANPHPLRVQTPVGIAWFKPREVNLVNDVTDDYDREKENL